MIYDHNNPFAKILRGELSCKFVYEDDTTKAFWSISPVAPVHILIVPKGLYIDYSDFLSHASDLEIASFFKTVAKIPNIMNLNNGYRIVINKGEDGGQTVFHFHAHVLGGKILPTET